MTVRAWTSAKARPADLRALPPDLTAGRLSESCAERRQGYTCTRRPLHTGRHAAGDGKHIRAVWPAAGRTAIIVGGPHHGSIVDMPDGTSTWCSADDYQPHAPHVQAHTVRRAWCRFDGEPTARTLRVVAGEDGVVLGGPSELVADAVSTAVRNGWLPTGPLVPGGAAQAFAGHVSGSAWVGGPL